jgi:peptidoglycan hydrolase-like protein with peptidoglycan-binding domain
VFTVTGGSANWQGSLANNGFVGEMSFAIWNIDSTTGTYETTAFDLVVNMTGTQVENFSGTLAAGTYGMYTYFGIKQNTSLSTFATFSIPAPGAVALLGAAGLIGARRRRD